MIYLYILSLSQHTQREVCHTLLQIAPQLIISTSFCILSKRIRPSIHHLYHPIRVSVENILYVGLQSDHKDIQNHYDFFENLSELEIRKTFLPILKIHNLIIQTLQDQASSNSKIVNLIYPIMYQSNTRYSCKQDWKSQISFCFDMEQFMISVLSSKNTVQPKKYLSRILYHTPIVCLKITFSSSQVDLLFWILSLCL